MEILEEACQRIQEFCERHHYKTAKDTQINNLIATYWSENIIFLCSFFFIIYIIEKAILLDNLFYNKIVFVKHTRMK